MPYNPGITYRGDQNLAAGIAGFGEAITRMTERRKAEAQEAKNLRALAAIYDPENKDQYTVMGLPELRAAGVAHAAKLQVADRQSQENLRAAQIGNLTADNERAAAFLKLQQDQDTRAKKATADREAFGRLLSEPVPANPLLDNPDVNAVFPGIAQNYRGPMAQLQRAMREAPGGIPPEAVQTFARVAAEMMDPNRRAVADAKTVTAQAALNNSLKPKGTAAGLTPYQKETLELRKTAMNDRRREAARRAALKELETSFDDSPEGQARRAELRERIDELSRLDEPAPPSSAVPAGFNLKEFKAWEGSLR